MSRKHLVHLCMFITERLASECCASVSVPPQDIGLGYGITILPMDVSAGVSPLFAVKVPSPPVGTPGQGGGGGGTVRNLMRTSLCVRQCQTAYFPERDNIKYHTYHIPNTELKIKSH